jgi:restriction endonuclease
MGRAAPWAEFEAAVAAFLSALDHGASVKANVRRPDRHTGKPRQRDVWIDARLLGHFPVSILVSCKRYQRRLNQQDIDAFEGERQSSGAQVGVIYSYRGFGAAALDKARNLGITCCRLYKEEPPELPMSLAIPSYCYRSQLRLDVQRITGDCSVLKTYEDLFGLQIPGSQGESVLDRIVETFRRLDSEASGKAGRIAGPMEHAAETTVRFDDGPVRAVRLRVTHRWQVYRGRTEAYLATGSHAQTSGHFVGQVAYPIIDTHSAHPGPGWELLDDASTIPDGPHVSTVFTQPDVRGAMLECLAPMALELELLAS